MNLLFLSVTSTVVCVLVAFIFKYLTLLNWVTGHAYVLSKRKKYFSIMEMLDLFKNVRPFPISCQKGWKIDSFSHGHPIWFNFLTLPHNLNAPSIKVYAAFDRVHSSSQALLQVLKNISKSSEWKPGVISSASTQNHALSEVPSSSHGWPSVTVHVDCVKEEVLSYSKQKFDLQKLDSWFTENVVPTVSLEYKRFWHKEDNGVCWLLQMNEKLQTCEFYLIQPVQELDQCLLSVVTWSREHSTSSVDRGAILLSSLTEYIALRRLHVTPLSVMTVPKDLSEVVPELGENLEPVGLSTSLLNKARNLIRNKQASDSSISKRKTDLEKYSSILRYGFKNGKSIISTNTGDAQCSTDIPTSDNMSTSFLANEGGDASIADIAKAPLKRSESDGAAILQSRKMSHEIERRSKERLGDNDGGGVQVPSHYFMSDENILEEDLAVTQYETMDNQCALQLLLEIRQASDINLELPSDRQAESSGGWLFSSFEKNIVVLKKMQIPGRTVQSYLGKGFVLAPPKTVWDAVRNPRTKFTYDETLKKVDIIATVNDTLKIVYFYHESLQFLKKESFDMCVLHGERVDGQKYILTYSSIEHEKCPVHPNITRARVLPSGWIIEPARQDNRVYSVVTFLMQIDFDRYSESSENLSFQEVISHYPLSIADLQQYLKPAVQMLRQKSVA